MKHRLVTRMAYCETNKLFHKDQFPLGGVVSKIPENFEIEYGLSEFIDHQVIDLQELPEQLVAGETVQTCNVILENDLAGNFKPGDRVYISGYIYIIPKSLRKDQFDVTFEHVFIANQIQSLELKKFESLTEETIQQFRRIAKRKDALDILAGWVAPSIYGHENVKKGLVLMCLGGNAIESDGFRIRGNIHILLQGDPGNGKSQLLTFIKNVMPQCIYTSGKGCSAPGLTASVSMCSDESSISLSAGAFVLADGGILCLDEFDKINEKVIQAIHEPMEQQTVTITKAGMNAQMNSRCSVLAGANNRDLPVTLLNRFDLIFNLYSNNDSQEQLKIANHLLDRTNQKDNENGYLFAQFIQQANWREPPVLTEEASDEIQKVYVLMRWSFENMYCQKTIRQPNPRTLESLIRLATAHAKLRFSNEVTVEDVQCISEIAKDNYSCFF